ncbi:hypothetical protein BDN70DRAFT_928557 [Pholiota conissans]|uniref:F-box domain-containing protein n=1 Tax=Pholiota conissans TaxID=109636 RepID=A0A9P6D5U0_9AGAR|nr:hypothetical protein BDN70DRAFT_928557 [Pholiota conissans]
MHRCLQFPEILGLIFENLTSNRRESERDVGQRSILAVLTTCRAFSIPAMVLLWRDLETLAPLILTMPGDLVEVSKHRSGWPKITFCRDVVPADWERFDIYAPFVITLGYDNKRMRFNFKKSPDIDNSVYKELQKRQQNLLPSLYAIGYNQITPIIHAPKVLSPVRRVDLNPGIMSGSHLHSLLAGIPKLAPSLKSLSLNFGIIPSARVLQSLLENTDLEEFNLYDSLSDEEFNLLARMPHLRKIDITKDISDLARLLSASPIADYQLTDACIRTNDTSPSKLPQVIAALRPSRLKNLRISPGSFPENVYGNEQALRDLIFSIAEHCSPDIFSSIRLETAGMYYQRPSGTLNYRSLRPLFEFTKLRKVDLSSHTFNLNDAEVKELAMSWPLLEELRAYVLIEPPSALSRTTLRSLLWFAVYCKNLNHLSFNFNDPDGEFSEEELTMASNSPLAELEVGTSTISEPEKVADFFCIVFPNLSYISWGSPYSDYEYVDMAQTKSWTIVQDGIDRLRSETTKVGNR